MRWLVPLMRAAAVATLLWALLTRAGCAFITNTCLGTNLFSYFTIHSNLLLLAVLVPALLYGLLDRPEPRWLTALRALATTYMAVTGVTFALMLANAQLFDHLFLVPLSSKVLHFVLPPYAVLDFLLAPGRHRLPWAFAWAALAYPVLWGAYTLVRGRMVDWYPYAFLDPAAVGGYLVVTLYAAALTVFILVVAFTTTAASRLPRTPAARTLEGRRRDRRRSGGAHERAVG